MEVALFAFALLATVLSLVWITIMWLEWYGGSSVRIAITGLLVVIAMPGWFIVLQSISKVLSH